MPGQRFAFSAMRRISAAPQSRPSCARRVGVVHSVCQEARRYCLPRRKGNSVRRPIPAANPLSQPRASVRGAVRRRARYAGGWRRWRLRWLWRQHGTIHSPVMAAPAAAAIPRPTSRAQVRDRAAPRHSITSSARVSSDPVLGWRRRRQKIS